MSGNSDYHYEIFCGLLSLKLIRKYWFIVWSLEQEIFSPPFYEVPYNLEFLALIGNQCWSHVYFVYCCCNSLLVVFPDVFIVWTLIDRLWVECCVTVQYHSKNTQKLFFFRYNCYNSLSFIFFGFSCHQWIVC